jgi:tricorn protease
MAFVSRGEVFVASVKSGLTKRLTRSAEQERSLSWAPDGQALYYAAERPNSWNIYRTVLARKDEKRFSRATLLKEEALLVSAAETFQPVVSPDGKHLAYIHNRDSIRVLDLNTLKTRVIVPGRKNYSYSDGDIRFDWSPDSRWLAFTYLANKRWLEDVGIAQIETGKISNISLSGYSESNPHWSADGQSLLFHSDRYGRRNHGSWGSDTDIMAFYLNKKGYQRSLLNEEDFELLLEEEREKEKEQKEGEKENEAKAAKKQKKGKGKTKAKNTQDKPQAKSEKVTKPITIDMTNREFRIKRMTIHSAPMGDFVMSQDGEALIYFAQVEKKWDLWLSHKRKSLTKKFLALGDARPGSLQLSADGKLLFVGRDNGRMEKVTLGGSLSGKGVPSRKPVSYSGDMQVDGYAERNYLFEHVWRQAQKKFYDPKLHGVDWDLLKTNYQAFLKSITNNHDFADLLSELLGELNASHTGSGYRDRGRGIQTAALGCLYDQAYEGPGLKIAHVLQRSPMDKVGSKIKQGVVITHMNGMELKASVNPVLALNGQVGKRMRLRLSNGDKKHWEEVIKPISLGAERQLLYARWIKTRKKLVNAMSKGRVGYVHVRSMGDSSFRTVYRETLGVNSDKEALIVDTRFNGGGWLHEDLLAFLSGKDYLHFVPRGKKFGDMGAEPFSRWTRPVVVVQSEGNYSDAHIFPYAFKKLKIGKLIGTPVAGTGTAVWWETLIDKSLYFGIPQVGMVTEKGGYLENQELQPDILVINGPNSMNAGRDLQLERSIQELLGQINRKK